MNLRSICCSLTARSGLSIPLAMSTRKTAV